MSTRATRGDTQGRRIRIALWTAVAVPYLLFFCTLTWVLLRPSTEWLDLRELGIMFGGLVAFVFSACILVLSMARRPRSWRIVVAATALLSVFTFVVAIVALGWEDRIDDLLDEETFYALMFLCVGLSYASLVFLPTLTSRGFWVQVYVAGLTVATTLYLTICAYLDSRDFWFVAGAFLASVVSLGGSAVAVMSVLAGLRIPDNPMYPSATLACPNCATVGEFEIGSSPCASCGNTVSVEVE